MAIDTGSEIVKDKPAIATKLGQIGLRAPGDDFFDQNRLPDDIADEDVKGIATGGLANLELETRDERYGRTGWEAIQQLEFATADNLASDLQRAMQIVESAEDISSAQKFHTYQEMASRLQAKTAEVGYSAAIDDALSTFRQHLETKYSQEGIAAVESIMDIADTKTRDADTLETAYRQAMNKLLLQAQISHEQRVQAFEAIGDLLKYYGQLVGNFGDRAESLYAEHHIMVDLEKEMGTNKFEVRLPIHEVRSNIDIKIAAAIALRRALPMVEHWSYSDVKIFLAWVKDNNVEGAMPHERETLVRWLKHQAELWYDASGIKEGETKNYARLKLRIAVRIALNDSFYSDIREKRLPHPNVAQATVDEFTAWVLAEHNVNLSLSGRQLVEHLRPLVAQWRKETDIDFESVPSADDVAKRGNAAHVFRQTQEMMRSEPTDYHHEGTKPGDIARKFGFLTSFKEKLFGRSRGR